MSWGYHTLIDLKNCNPESIRSKNYIEKYIAKLVALIEMRAYGSSTIVHFGDDPSVKGFSVVQLIETSLISGHFVELTNCAYIDIFSCKDYDWKEAALFTKRFFSAEIMVRKLIKRGDAW